MCHNRSRFTEKAGAAGTMPYAVLGFLLHAAAYMIVTMGLVAINLLFWNGYFWAVWPMLGWGIGVFSHGRATFSALPGASRADRRHPRLNGGDIAVSAEEWKRVTRRLENLEAIVTSDEWDDRPAPHEHPVERGDAGRRDVGSSGL